MCHSQIITIQLGVFLFLFFSLCYQVLSEKASEMMTKIIIDSSVMFPGNEDVKTNFIFLLNRQLPKIQISGR